MRMDGLSGGDCIVWNPSRPVPSDLASSAYACLGHPDWRGDRCEATSRAGDHMQVDLCC